MPRWLTREGLVGVAGSSALFWYQEKEKVGPKWGVPGDIDIFACMDPDDFIGFMGHVQKKLIRSFHQFDLCFHVHTYIDPNKPIRIFDYRIWSLGITLSFVESPFADLHETAMNFDIDVCKVIHPIHGGGPQPCTRKVKQAIARKLATVTREFQVEENQVSDEDMARFTHTMARVRKYQIRGFIFEDMNGIGIRNDSDGNVIHPIL